MNSNHMSREIEIETIHAVDRLMELEQDWWALWHRCPTATPFQSPAWLITWWRHFRPGELRCIAVRRHGTLVALALLYLEHGNLHRLLPIGISLSDYLDLLVDPAYRSDALAGILKGVCSFSWDCWELEQLPPDATALDLARVLPGQVQTIPHTLCPVLELRTDGPMGGVPARRRRQLRRAEAFAIARGPVSIDGMEGQPGNFFQILARLHSMSWHSRGQQGVLAEGRAQRFHREALVKLAVAGLAICYVLRIGPHSVAAFYGFRHRHRFYAYLGGFDPDFARESPGAILIGHAIRQAIGQGIQEFDFLRGQEAYKYTWGATDRWTTRLRISRAAQ